MSRPTLGELHARTTDALDELAELGSHDPAATGAVHALKLARDTLDRFWLPTLDQLAAGRIE